jgi:hypothetical protein
MAGGSQHERYVCKLVLSTVNLRNSLARHPHNLVIRHVIVLAHWTILEWTLGWQMSLIHRHDSPILVSSSLKRGSPSITASVAGIGPCGPVACINCSRIWSNPSVNQLSTQHGLTFGSHVIAYIHTALRTLHHPFVAQYAHQHSELGLSAGPDKMRETHEIRWLHRSFRLWISESSAMTLSMLRRGRWESRKESRISAFVFLRPD